MATTPRTSFPALSEIPPTFLTLRRARDHRARKVPGRTTGADHDRVAVAGVDLARELTRLFRLQNRGRFIAERTRLIDRLVGERHVVDRRHAVADPNGANPTRRTGDCNARIPALPSSKPSIRKYSAVQTAAASRMSVMFRRARVKINEFESRRPAPPNPASVPATRLTSRKTIRQSSAPASTEGARADHAEMPKIFMLAAESQISRGGLNRM